MFKIIHDLSTLSEVEKKQYLKDYSTYLGLNPDENRLDMIWLNTDGLRTLIAYCRRGTTDILRNIHGISVTSLIKEDGPGYTSYQAIGRDKNGRQEIAIGAYATTGMLGDRLAAAVATAQTRALRRLTLQFVGGGLLDESEVNHQTVRTEADVVIPPPPVSTAQINNEIGKLAQAWDAITGPKPLSEPSEVSSHFYHYDVLPSEPIPVVEPAATMSVPANLELVNAILKADSESEPTPAIKKPRKTRKAKNTIDMGDPTPESRLEPTQAPESRPEPTLHQNPPERGVSLQTQTEVKPAVPVCPDCNAPMAADDRLDLYLCVKHGRVDTTIKPSQKTLATAQQQTLVQAPVAPPVEPAKTISVLTDQQQKLVKARLVPYWLEILPKGGMTAEDGVGIWEKLIKFANSFYPELPDYKKWTFDKWEDFFKNLDEKVKVVGPKGLVEIMNHQIGVK
jgi:hypothetical protein